MKILYVALKYDYGDPKRGFSFEHYNFYDSLVKMEQEKHQIVYFPFDEIMTKKGKKEMNKELLKTVRREKPDLCFFFLFRDEVKKETIKTITQKYNTKTFNWFADDHFRFCNFSKYYAPLFSWVSTTDSEAIEKYNKINCKNVIKTQWACNHSSYKPYNLEKIYDVSFIGQPHSERRNVVDLIKRTGISVECRGNGWKRGRISQDEMIKMFSQSKINLNLTKSSSGNSFRSIVSIFLKKELTGQIRITNPRHWSGNFQSILAKKRDQVKGRNFEIPGSGGFLLTSNADNLSDYYRDGKEIIIYKNNDEMIEKIKYYLEHDKEREAVARAGHKRTLQEHTYEKRFNDIFKIMGLNL